VLWYIGIVAVVGYIAVSWIRMTVRERREIAALQWPTSPWVGVDAKALNVAVTTFVYGLERQPVPGSHEAAVRSRFGSRSGPLLELLRECLDLALRIADEVPDAGDGTAAEVARRVREARPDLGEDAAASLAAWALAHRPSGPPPAGGWAPL
jgi:hypothetical protein